MPSQDEIRDQQRETWDKFSPGWDKWDNFVMKMLAPTKAEMLGHLDIRDYTTHLDVAAGTGEPGLTIAASAPKGKVVITDLSPGMLEVAAKNAAEKGLGNVEVRQASAEQLPFEDGTFDSVTCRFGFMFFPDIQGAANEFARVLKPGGKVVAAVWAEPPGNPWITIPVGIISAEVGIPAPPPDAPGMFRCATPGAMTQVFEKAGLRDVREHDVRSQMEAPMATYWEQVTEVAAPVVAGLAQATPEGRERIKAAVLSKWAEYETDGVLHVPMHSRVIEATK